MRILGIETSCDETSAAVVEDGRLVLSDIVASQIDLHAVFGGVVPEIASRQHLRVISHVVAQALSEAEVNLDHIDAVAATRGPGLAGSLLVGMNFAQGLVLGLELPLLPANHLDGHLHSVWLTQRSPPPPAPEMPLLALIVSGGHTELVLMSDHGQYTVVGRTLDDAAGEAFDKVARLMGLPYPGGPAIQRAAEDASHPMSLPRAWLRDTFDFSFSGLKTATLHAVHHMVTAQEPDTIRGIALPQIDVAHKLSEQQVADLAAGFQESVVDVLVTKSAKAANQFNVRSVAVVGGVAANRRLGERMREEIALPLFISEPRWSTDNAAMIASAAFFTGNREACSEIAPSLALCDA